MRTPIFKFRSTNYKRGREQIQIFKLNLKQYKSNDAYQNFRWQFLPFAIRFHFYELFVSFLESRHFVNLSQLNRISNFSQIKCKIRHQIQSTPSFVLATPHCASFSLHRLLSANYPTMENVKFCNLR